MRGALIFGVIALAGCGERDPEPRLAAPVTAPDAAALSCPSGDVIDVEGFTASGRPLADTRALLEDELRPFDRVEQVDAETVRVVRGARVVAVVHFDGARIDRLDVCASLTR